jgi:hypothetical protein
MSPVAETLPNDVVALLWPRPRHVISLGDGWLLSTRLVVSGLARENELAADAALGWLALALERHGLQLERGRDLALDDESASLALRDSPSGLEAQLRGVTAALPAHATRQGYVLRVASGELSIQHAGPLGLLYALATLAQLVENAAHLGGRSATAALHLPAIEIIDYPDFAERGVMLDISRDKVPTLETLRAVIDRLARWKVNQLQLYMEHTFAYSGHELVWRDASPLTASEVRALDDHCAARGVQLVPNQNSFGHMHRWLAHEPYRALAECPDGFDHPWNWSKEPYGLCATDPASLRFLETLYDELLPCFRSRSFNVGLDETIDLGAGRSRAACAARGTERVYLEFLQAVNARVRARGHVMMFWGDIIIHRPELLGELPREAIALEWGYEADHPFTEHLAAFRDAGLPFYVCPGTSSWNSFGGRTLNAVLNIASAARAGLAAGASGLLVTDWGDHGHLQPLPVSYLGLLLGAGLSWNASDATDPLALDLPTLLDAHVFGDPTRPLGRIAYDLGEAYRHTGSLRANATVLFWNLIKPERVFSPPGVTRESLEATLAFVSRVGAPLDAPGPVGDGPEGAASCTRGGPSAASPLGGTPAALELTWVRDMLAFSCRLGIARTTSSDPLALATLPSAVRASLARELADLIDRHRALWLVRNRPGGLDDSARRLEQTLAALGGR